MVLSINLFVFAWIYIVFTQLVCAQDGSLFEGDIVWDDTVATYYSSRDVASRDKRDVGNSTSYAWIYSTYDNDGSLSYTIPYDLSAIGARNSRESVQIELAMKEWNKGTCILFVEKTTEKNYVNIVPGRTCSSHVGMRGGAQNLTLDPGCQYDKGKVMHELAHILGLFHEHTRTDRDSHVEILYDNLVNGTQNRNFQRMTRTPGYVKNDNYDYISIMHYGKTYFSKAPGNQTTIRTLDPAYQDAIGQRAVLSKLDVEKVNSIYNCDCKIVSTNETRTVYYNGKCTFWFVTWDCVKEKEVTEVVSKKVCTDATSANDT